MPLIHFSIFSHLFYSAAITLILKKMNMGLPLLKFSFTSRLAAINICIKSAFSFCVNLGFLIYHFLKSRVYLSLFLRACLKVLARSTATHIPLTKDWSSSIPGRSSFSTKLGASGGTHMEW